MIALLATFACGDQTLGDLPGDGGSTSTTMEDAESGSSSDDGEPPTLGAVGTRCTQAGDCAADLECFTEFSGERPVCTATCDGDVDCPDGNACVVGIPDYRDGTPPLPGYCMQACLAGDTCEALGSTCEDVDGVDGRYCF